MRHLLTVALALIFVTPAFSHHRLPSQCEDHFATSKPRSPGERMTSLPAFLGPDPLTGCLGIGAICILNTNSDVIQPHQEYCAEASPGHPGVTLAQWCARLAALPLPNGFTATDFRPHCPPQWLAPLGATFEIPADIRKTFLEAPHWADGPGKAAKLKRLREWALTGE